MVSVQEFAGLLTRVWQSRSHKAGNIAPDLRDDFLPGYTDAVLDLGRRYGITWTSEHEFQVDPPARTSGPGELASIAAAVMQLRENARQDEQEDQERLKESQAPGYFLGYERALCDIVRELGLTELTG